LGYMLIVLSVINGVYQEFLADHPEYYIPVIIFCLGVLFVGIDSLRSRITR